jgi:hypothetical protein
MAESSFSELESPNRANHQQETRTSGTAPEADLTGRRGGWIDPKRIGEQRLRIAASPSPFLAMELFAFSAAEMAFVTLMWLDEFAGIVIFLVGRATRINDRGGFLACPDTRAYVF